MFNMNSLHWRTIYEKTSDRKSEFPEIFTILQFTPYTFKDAWNTNCFKTKIIKKYKTWCKPRKTSLLWLQRLALFTKILVAVTAAFFVQKSRFYSSLNRTSERKMRATKGSGGIWASRPISNGTDQSDSSIIVSRLTRNVIPHRHGSPIRKYILYFPFQNEYFLLSF